MVFIDNLAYSLFSLSVAGFLVIYLVLSVYMAYRKNKKDYNERMNGVFAPLLVVSVYMIISAAYGQFAWPLPGSYNILFYDPLASFGLLLLALAITLRYKYRLRYVGFLGLLFGAMTIFYGYQGYLIGLTKSPIALLGMYGFYGLAGIFAYPVSIMMERITMSKNKPGALLTICLVIFLLAMLAAVLLSAYIAIEAVPAHLLSPP